MSTDSTDSPATNNIHDPTIFQINGLLKIKLSQFKYFTFTVIGIALLWPWNCFLSASAYYGERFVNSPSLVKVYSSTMMSVSTITSTAYNFYLSQRQTNVNYNFRVQAGFCITIFVFLFMAVSCVSRSLKDLVMATGLSEHHNMVWEVKTNQMPNAVQKLSSVMDKRAPGMSDSSELSQCNENLPSSPGYNSCDEHMELDDLPELQAVQSDPTQSAIYQLSSDVSHQEYPRSSWSQNTSDIPENTHREDEVDWLTELANIATSPQSPSMQCSFYNRSSPVHIIATSKSLHSYARPPPVSSSSKSGPAFPHDHWKEETPVRHERANSESESGIFCMSSSSDDDDSGWCNSWPSTIWHCFSKGTRSCFHKESNKEWQDVEDFARAASCDNEEEIQMGTHKGYGSDGLKLLSHEESVSFGESVSKLTFDPGTVEDGLLTVECKSDHPFYVKNKGWSSFYPSLTVVQHGIPCCEIHIGDVCLPPGHPDAINFDDSGVFDTFKSYDFTPMDSSAVYVLSSMARQRRASSSCGGGPGTGQEFSGSEFSKSCGSPGSSQLSSSSLYAKAVKSHSSGTVSATSPNKCKRPMNAFMLFAKKYRVEYTQMYPGKDNRAISVILGDRWKKMKNEERRMYTLEAKALAEEQKRLNPDCWKRKRTNSGSQQH